MVEAGVADLRAGKSEATEVGECLQVPGPGVCDFRVREVEFP